MEETNGGTSCRHTVGQNEGNKQGDILTAHSGPEWRKQAGGYPAGTQWARICFLQKNPHFLHITNFHSL